MEPLPELAGFGTLVNFDWVLSQKNEDPEGIFS
jgi:hypothetical protein